MTNSQYCIWQLQYQDKLSGLD